MGKVAKEDKGGESIQDNDGCRDQSKHNSNPFHIKQVCLLKGKNSFADKNSLIPSATFRTTLV